MPRPQTQLEALTLGQLARRWGVSAARVRVLVESGRLPGAFRIPSVGCYGETIKIPLAGVVEIERQWAINGNSGATQRPRAARRTSGSPKLKHFPELNRPIGADFPENAQSPGNP